MSDLIIEGAKGIPDGLYVIKDGEMFKYKSKGGTVRTYPIADRPRGRWHYSDGKPATIGQSFGVICDQCGAESEYCTNFCGECGADMRETKGET